MNIWFDRTKGWLTAQEEDGSVIVLRHPARSGHSRFQKRDWVRGKSPIPKGEHYLWLNPVYNGKTFDMDGIGLFWPISNRLDNRRLITDGVNARLDIGLHPENRYAGSLGCIVLLWDTPELKSQVEKLFNRLRQEAEAKVKHIPLYVV